MAKLIDLNGLATFLAKVKQWTNAQISDAVDGLAEGDAAGITYDNTESGIEATNVQDAIDELKAITAESEGGGFNYTEDATTIYLTGGGYVDTTPRMSVVPTEINLSPAIGDEVTRNIVVRGYNLSGNITIQLTDTSGYYSIDSNTLPPEGGTIVLTYNPTASGTHQASLYIDGGEVNESVTINGVASSPTITASEGSISLGGASGDSVSKTVRVSGTSLGAPITISVDGAGWSASTHAIGIAQAVNGVDVVFTFDGTSDSGSAIITLSSTGATDVVITASYQAYQPVAVGSDVTPERSNGDTAGLRFLVISNTETTGDTNKVAVMKSGTSIAGDITLPSWVEDINGLRYSVTQIGRFSGNQRMTGITIPDSVTSYYSNGSYASDWYTFSECTNLSRVTFGNGLTSTASYMFDRCPSLQSIVLPDCMTNCGNNTTANSSLRTIQIGTSSACQMEAVFSLFRGASHLETDICYKQSPLPSFGYYAAFTDDFKANGHLRVTANMVDVYSSTSPWSDVQDIQAIEEEE